jgi:hypothetical protein
MSEVSFNPSQKAPNGHQSLGQGGTFWLPPKMKVEKFESNLKQFSNPQPSSSKSPSGSAPKPQTLAHLAKGTSKSLLPHVKVSEATTGKSSIRKIAANSAINSTHTRSDSSIRSVLQGKPLALVPLGNPILSNGKDWVNQSLVPTTSTFVKGTSFAKSSNGTRSKTFQGAPFRSLHDGTESALSDLSDYIPPRNSPKNTLDDTAENRSVCLSFEQLSQKVSEFISDVPLLLAQQNEVFRFAVSLGNGSSVSVRIENMTDSVAVSFISEDRQVLEDLHLEFPNSPISNNNGCPKVAFHFFESFSQLDRYFS